MSDKPLHIFPGVRPEDVERQVALPMTFYLSHDVLDDEGIRDEFLADLLHDDLLAAVRFIREERAKGIKHG